MLEIDREKRADQAPSLQVSRSERCASKCSLEAAKFGQGEENEHWPSPCGAEGAMRYPNLGMTLPKLDILFLTIRGPGLRSHWTGLETIPESLHDKMNSCSIN
jgi:hypothetical protein